jgi:hypothetical protein
VNDAKTPKNDGKIYHDEIISSKFKFLFNENYQMIINNNLKQLNRFGVGSVLKFDYKSVNFLGGGGFLMTVLNLSINLLIMYIFGKLIWEHLKKEIDEYLDQDPKTVNEDEIDDQEEGKFCNCKILFQNVFREELWDQTLR